jgi:transcriptional regulator with XRE-family HTH domain
MLNMLDLVSEVKLKFHQWFLLRRKELGLTQDQIADALGVSGQTVSNWENARSVPTLRIEQIKIFCQLLHCTLDEIPSSDAS